jgi:hypothetical protein
MDTTQAYDLVNSAIRQAAVCGIRRDGWGAVEALWGLVKSAVGGALYRDKRDFRQEIINAYREGEKATPAPATLTPELLDHILFEAVSKVARVVQDAIGEHTGDEAGLFFSDKENEQPIHEVARRLAIEHAEFNGINVDAVRAE